jgi:ribosome maturation protein Sdo1
MDGASKATLENEFGTHVDDEVIKQILEKGTIQESQVRSSSLQSFSP